MSISKLKHSDPNKFGSKFAVLILLGMNFVHGLVTWPSHPMCMWPISRLPGALGQRCLTDKWWEHPPDVDQQPITNPTTMPCVRAVVTVLHFESPATLNVLHIGQAVAKTTLMSLGQWLAVQCISRACVLCGLLRASGW